MNVIYITVSLYNLVFSGSRVQQLVCKIPDNLAGRSQANERQREHTTGQIDSSRVRFQLNHPCSLGTDGRPFSLEPPLILPNV